MMVYRKRCRKASDSSLVEIEESGIRVSHLTISNNTLMCKKTRKRPRKCNPEDVNEGDEDKENASLNAGWQLHRQTVKNIEVLDAHSPEYPKSSRQWQHSQRQEHTKPQGCLFGHGEILDVEEGTVAAMRRRENDYTVNREFMERQPLLSFRMRAILLDWMMEVSQEFKLKRETFHYAINYVDRYLSNVPEVPKERLQLAGVTALFIAAKIEEIYPPTARAFAAVTDHAFTIGDIFGMEAKMLEALQWNLCPVTAYAWLNLYMHELQGAKEKSKKCGLPRGVLCSSTFKYASDVVDCALLHPESTRFKPSLLAASCLLLATMSSQHREILESSAYTLDDLEPCTSWLRLWISTLPCIEVTTHPSWSQIESEEEREDLHTLQTHHSESKELVLESIDICASLPSSPIELQCNTSTDSANLSSSEEIYDVDGDDASFPGKLLSLIADEDVEPECEMGVADLEADELL